MSEQEKKLNTPVTVPVEILRPGHVIFRAPGNLMVQDVVTTGSLEALKKKPRPLLVLEVDKDTQQVTVTYITSFSDAYNITGVALQGGANAKKLFIPIKPATREFDHDPINWESNGGDNRAGWVSIRSKMVLTREVFKVMDLTKSFSRETAAAVNNLIKVVVTND